LLRQSDDFGALRRIALSWARLIAQADGATFVLRDGGFCFYVDEDAVAPLWRGQRFDMAQCITGHAMLHAEVVVIPDITVDERVPQDAYRPTFVRSLVAVPMGTGDTGTADPVGALGLYWSETGRTASPEMTSELIDLATEVGRAVCRLAVDTAPWAPNFALPDAGRRDATVQAGAESRQIAASSSR
jgi:GAF domain-containing protein